MALSHDLRRRAAAECFGLFRLACSGPVPIHPISIPLTNTPMSPARSAGDAYGARPWLFWPAPRSPVS